MKPRFKGTLLSIFILSLMLQGIAMAAGAEDFSGHPTQGPANAPVTIVEFGDYHCPFCRTTNPTMEKLLSQYDGKIRRVFKHYPLEMHPAAKGAHRAAICAQNQGKFWGYHKVLFENQAASRSREGLLQLAGQAGLDLNQMNACLDSGNFEMIDQDIASGDESGVRGTPAFLVNGKLISGAVPFEIWDQIIQEELKLVS